MNQQTSPTKNEPDDSRKQHDVPAEQTDAPDFAKGERRLPKDAEEVQGPDFAKGERRLPKTAEETQGPDFAKGERDLPKPAGEHADFARGQDDDDLKNKTDAEG